jgi:hypothetical protein
MLPFGYKLVTQPHFINLGKQGLNIFMHLEKTWKHENMKISLTIWNVIVNISCSQTFKGGRHGGQLRTDKISMRVIINRIEEQTQSCIITSCNAK